MPNFWEQYKPAGENDQIRAGVSGPMGATDDEIAREADATRTQLAQTNDADDQQLLQDHLDDLERNRTSGTSGWWSKYSPSAQRALPTGTSPSTAGAVRGSVNPAAVTQREDDAQPLGDPMGTGFSEILAQPTGAPGSVLNRYQPKPEDSDARVIGPSAPAPAQVDPELNRAAYVRTAATNPDLANGSVMFRPGRELQQVDDAIARHDAAVNVQRASRPEATAGNIATGLQSSLALSAFKTVQGLRQEWADASGDTETSQEAQRFRKLADQWEQQSTPNIDSPLGEMTYQGVAGLANAAPIVAAGTLNPWLGVGLFAGQAQAEGYGKYRARGATPGEAALGGGLEGAIMAGTSAIPLKFISDKIGKVGMGEFITGLVARDVPTMVAQGIANDMVDTAVANPSKTWGEFVAEQPAHIAQSVVSAAIFAAGMGAGHATAKAARQGMDIIQSKVSPSAAFGHALGQDVDATQLAPADTAAAQEAGFTPNPNLAHTASVADVMNAPTLEAAAEAAQRVAAPSVRDQMLDVRPLEQPTLEQELAQVRARQADQEITDAGRDNAVPPVAAGADRSGLADAAAGVADRVGPVGEPGGPVAGDAAADRAEGEPVSPRASDAVGELSAEPNPSGTLSVRGAEPQAVLKLLRDNGITSAVRSADGVLVGRSQAEQAQRVVADFQRPEVIESAPGQQAAQEPPASLAPEAVPQKLANNPFRTFLMRQGVALKLAQEFAPGVKERLAMGRTFRRNGQDLDALAERAWEEGYLSSPDDVNGLYDMITRSVGGERIAPLYGNDAQAELQARAQRHRALNEDMARDFTPEELEFHGFNAADQHSQARVAEIIARAQEHGIDAESILEDAAKFTENGTHDDYLKAARASLDAALSRGGSEGARDRGQPAGGAREASGGRAEEGLTRPSADDVVAQRARRAQGERDEATRRAGQEARARADAELPDFGLTGSDRPADANPDQEGLFRRGEQAGSEAATAHVAAVQKIVGDAKKDWKGAPPIRVVPSYRDLPVKAPADARAFYRDGKVWLVAGAREHAEGTALRKRVLLSLAHEVIGHYGARAVLGDAHQQFLKNIELAIRSGNKAISAIRDEVDRIYVDDHGEPNLTPRDRSDEIAARVVENAIDKDGNFRPGFGMVKAVFSKIAQWLRENVPAFKNLPLSHSELQGVLVRALRQVEQGPKSEQARPSFAAAARSSSPSVSDVLLSLGKRDALHQLPRSGKADMQGIAADKGLRVTDVNRNSTDNTEWMLANTTPKPSEGGRSWMVELPAGGKATITEQGKDVYVNLSALHEGQGGRAVYDLAANYALNNGKRLIGDPAGVTPAAMRRRLENMLSSAIKYGTTDHLLPHPDQVSGREDLGVPPLDWHDGDTAGNIERMVRASVDATADSNPIATSNVHFDPATQSFRDGEGHVLDDAQLRGMLGFDDRGRRAGSAGDATLRRNALFRALLSGMGARRAQMEAVHPEPVHGEQGPRGALDGSFYARDRDAVDEAFARSATADELRERAPIGAYHAYDNLERVERRPSGSIADSIAKALVPAGRATETGGIIRANLAEQARGREVAQQRLMEFAKRFDAMPVKDNYAFIDAMERGVPMKNRELDRAAAALRKILDERRDQVRALGNGSLENFNENYFPHIWKDPASAANFFTRRPLEGGKGFLKQRKYDYFSDGMNAGLEPITTNPVELALLKAREMDRYIYGQRIFGEMKEAGTAKFVAFGAKAPDGWEKINDKIARVMQYSEAEKGMILRGEYYAPEQAATLINNHLSPGLSGVAAFDMVRRAGNMMNAVQLGLSAFHLGFTTLDAMISKAALGIKQASRGDIGKGVGNVLQSLNPAQPFMNLYKGDRLLKAYMGNVNDPDLAPIVEALVQGGGRVKMDDVYRNAAVNEFRQAVRKSQWGTAALKAIPRVMDLINKPIFEWLVPRQKLGVFFDMAKDALEKNPEMNLQEKRQVMGKLWDSVDNRMGELVYDNVFWNRALKDALMVSVRSVGWNLGTFREIGGGIKDIKDIPKLGGLSDRTAYIFGLTFVTAIIGSLTQYLMTGEAPKELKDVFFPRTGKLRPDGTQDRLSLPSYIKDIYEYGHDLRNFVKYGDNPFNTLGNKLHPLISTVTQIITNKDFFGAAIRSPGDAPMQQAVDEAKYMLKQLTPFSLRNYLQQARVKGEEPSIAGYLSSPSMIGITPSPGYITKTDEEAQSAQVSKMRDALVHKFREEVRDGAYWGDVDRRAKDAGLGERDREYIKKAAENKAPKKLKAFADH